MGVGELRGEMLTVAQISDLHIGIGDGLNPRRNRKRLEQTLSAIAALRPKPVSLIVSGDTVENGTPEEYDAAADFLDDLELPTFYALGNHDRRAAFAASRLGRGSVWDDGWLQYSADLGEGLRLVVADTLDEGRPGGAFCERRAVSLAGLLDRAPETPTLLVLHHPPTPSGIQWMDADLDPGFVSRLEGVVGGRKQVQAIACGHFHRAFHAPFAGTIVSAAPATTIQLTLDMTAIDVQQPDGRELLVEEPAGYALHAWDGRRLTTHVCQAGDFAPAVFYQQALETLE